jgi:hypothetical protein
MFTRPIAVLALMIFTASAGFAVGPDAHANGPSTLFQWFYEEDSDGGSKLDEPLVTDRPDFTEASTTVGQGVVQLETGYTFTTDAEDGVRTTNHSFPETLLRVGVLADWLEFRVDWNYEVERTRAGGVAETRSGADDLTLGFKIALTEQQCNLPETAVILQFSVPSGGDAFTADEVLPGINYLYSWELNDDWSLGASTGFVAAVDDETNDTYSQFSQSLSLGRGWNDKVGSYTEWSVLSPIGADTNRPENYLNGGFTYLINKDVQWDIRAGVGLNDAADNFFAGTGISLRYY